MSDERKYVHAKVTNKSGGVVTLLLDEDDERIEYFKKLVKRDELESVEFSSPTEKPPAKKAAAKKAAAPTEKPPADPPANPPADK